MTRLKPIAPEEIPYSGRIFQIVHQQMGDGQSVKTFEIARRAPGVRLIIVRDGQILLTREFRYELGRYDYRLPGGKVFDRLGDYQDALNGNVDMTHEAAQAATREAQEEVGIAVKNLTPWAMSSCGATVQWDLFFFVARDFNVLDHVDHESGEDLTHEWVDFNTARAMALDGRMDEERAAIQVLKFIEKETTS